jgi:hypothetical protein
MKRNPERGSAMMVTMIVVTSLLAGSSILVGMQMSSNRSNDLARSSMSAMYCAEAGLVAARSAVYSNYAQWNAALAAGTEPSWMAGVNHDIDGDGVADFTITLKDNDDELPPLANDPTHDNDLKVFVVSTCTKYPDTPKQVMELVQYTGSGNCYQSQQGGCGGNGNGN